MIYFEPDIVLLLNFIGVAPLYYITFRNNVNHNLSARKIKKAFYLPGLGAIKNIVCNKWNHW